MPQQSQALFADLYDQYAAQVYGILVNSLNDEEQAQKWLLHIFQQAYRQRASMPAQYKLSWLLQLAHQDGFTWKGPGRELLAGPSEE